MNDILKGSDKATEEETKKLIQLGRETKERQLNLEREYSDRMLQIINNRQLLSLHEAEQEFRELLLRRLEQRRKGRPEGEQFREDNIDRMRKNRTN